MRSNEKYRVTNITKDGKRISKMMNERELQILRARRLKEIRKNELGLTQKDLAMAVGVNVRTLQDWELGRSPMPRPVEKLMNLMKKIPSIKKDLLSEAL
jgi:DNA-binding transcriptional regulator YiaG